jgi:hypothetical protein
MTPPLIPGSDSSGTCGFLKTPWFTGYSFRESRSPPGAEMSEVEDLSSWRNWKGVHLGSCRVLVWARPGRHHIQALVQPA